MENVRKITAMANFTGSISQTRGRSKEGANSNDWQNENGRTQKNKEVINLRIWKITSYVWKRGGNCQGDENTK